MVYINTALGTASRTGQTLAGIMAWIIEFLMVLRLAPIGLNILRDARIVVKGWELEGH